MRLLLDTHAFLLFITNDTQLSATAKSFHHRDPFDRMLVAQAQAEKLSLVSNDVILDLYGIDRIW